jgi:hypothetical protein
VADLLSQRRTELLVELAHNLNKTRSEPSNLNTAKVPLVAGTAQLSKWAQVRQQRRSNCRMGLCHQWSPRAASSSRRQWTAMQARRRTARYCRRNQCLLPRIRGSG